MRYGKALAYDHEAVDFDIISHEALPPRVRKINMIFTKIFRKAGVRRLSSRIPDITLSSLRIFLRNTLKRAISVMILERKKTLCLMHMLYALK